ncbi:tRNA threonylcarbamoyladenosine dehydratase [Tannerella sp. oral taxon 808]|nr:tRNA threonylcarbamoyladenosine dehydratase [Tannerella sp. oral taxon 808]
MNESALPFSRTELLIGREAMDRMQRARIILFGVGGVGSWCAESLVRSGIRRLTLVDSDRVSPTNINRQLPASVRTVGQLKVDVLRERFIEINPDAEIEAVASAYNAETSDTFRLETYDYILDAIDSLSEKVHLIRTATGLPRATFFSSMGAALKLDPQRIRVAPFSRVAGCPLAAALRRRLKQGEPPAHDFLCVYSDEVLENRGTVPSDTDASVWDARKARINGTIAHTTAIFGFTLASLVVQHLCTHNS